MEGTTLFVHRLTVPLVFHSGIAPGAGKPGGNQLTIARDGEGRPVLRGSAMAGVLRHAWAARRGFATSALGSADEVSRWFGFALGDDVDAGDNHRCRPSPLRTADAVLCTGLCSEPLLRHHNSIDRHVGAVRDGGLFALEYLPPGTRATAILCLHLADEEDDGEARSFLQALLSILGSGAVIGGHGARGIGMVSLDHEARYQRFDLRNLDECAAWLDESWTWRQGVTPLNAPTTGEPMVPTLSPNALKVSLVLTIPRGQDICIGDGVGLELPIEPQRVTTVGGGEHWRIPGSSLRGVFRAWASRLAARAAARGKGVPPADSTGRFLKNGCVPANGDLLGWVFVAAKDRQAIQQEIEDDPEDLASAVTCPVARLFGSLFSASRIHIADALSASPIQPAHSGQRKHVGVDRITGGASEGFLFDHAALLPGPRFPVTITVRDPEETEVEWLLATVRALDLGLIRVGSAKSSGRLALAAAPEATGPFSDRFKALKPCEA